MNRNRLPRWVNATIDRIADSPTSPLGRIAARRYGKPVPGAVGTTAFDDRPVRVLIAPVNYSGQAFAWSRALERRSPRISARTMAIEVPGGFDYPSDLLVPIPTYHNDTAWQRDQFAAATTATHVLIEAEEPPFGRLLGRSVAAQAAALGTRGVDVAYLAHGTDVRLPSRHMRDHPWSHYADPEVYAARDEVVAARNIAFLESSGRPVFVSTPDLREDLPTARWLPVTVDVARWERPRTARTPGARLRVAHAPSVSVIKGTHLIRDTLERLQAEGVIELDLIQGVPTAQMPDRFAAADVVIDQLRIGSYGVAACEALASGCIVVGHLSERVRATVREETGLEPPIVEATPDTIEGVLRELAAHDGLDALRATGDTFVRAVHDGRRSAAVLDEAWLHATAPDPHEEDTDASPR
ncbi:glycosyltransferase [Microbacterium sp. K41]|uniref:glycosyltransferase n=1 Tax=Microbacterium sp. K41 TaxID=2305437 RepID=UPI00109D27FF|nr:glycosyltransferase [Microbacterium sp. K41]